MRDTVLSTVVMMLHSTFPRLTYFITEVCTFWSPSPIVPYPDLGRQSVLCIYEFRFCFLDSTYNDCAVFVFSSDFSHLA